MKIDARSRVKGDIDVSHSEFLLDNGHLVSNHVLSNILDNERSIYNGGSVRL